MANYGAQTNGAYDLCDLLDITWEEFDRLTEDAREAVDELYDELTVMDYTDCNRYWNEDVDEGMTNILIEKYAERIWNEDGTAKTE